MPPLLPELSPCLCETTLHYSTWGWETAPLPRANLLAPGPSEPDSLVTGLCDAQKGHVRAVFRSGPGVPVPICLSFLGA